MSDPKHVVITGASRGIGAAIARLLDEQGFRLTLMARGQEALEQLCGELRSATAVTVDVTDLDSINQAFGQAQESSGPVDVLVNNAGGTTAGPFHKLTAAQWRQDMALNLDSAFYCSQAVIAGMLDRQWGRIINIASTAGQKAYSYVSAYCAAKHGMIGLTRALALEYATKGITVNAICPGYTETDLVRAAITNIADKTGRSEEQAHLELVSSNPQKRLIQPEEVAHAVLWLCSDQASSVNGQSIALAGGEVM